MKHPQETLDNQQVIAQGAVLNRITSRIRQSLELEEILSATVAEIRAFLKTDRVKVYKFHADGSGQVIAESIEGDRLPSLLGLNFPADDIPPQTREMFIKARYRTIVNVSTQQMHFSQLEPIDTMGTLTVEDVQKTPVAQLLQRPVDPCHLDYLNAMGVQSTLVVPILHQNHLWGLLVSHHAEPYDFSEVDLQLVQMVADQVSIAIAQATILSSTREKAQREAIVNQISTLLHAPLNIQDILQLVLEKIVLAVQGSGGRLYLVATESNAEPVLYTFGTQPYFSVEQPEPLLEDSDLWQHLIRSTSKLIELPDLFDNVAGLQINPSDWNPQSGIQMPLTPVQIVNDLYQEPLFTPLASGFQNTPIRGMLLMPLQYRQQYLGCLSIFRDEIDTETLWAGQYDLDARQEKPRVSFTAWRELKVGQAHAWTENDTEMVKALGTHLSMAVMQSRLYQCEREQRILVEMRNKELHTARTAAEDASRIKSDFLSSTSHELRTPLASTLNYLKLLKEGFYDNEQELQEYIEIAHQSAENLVAIINDVLDIAKIEAGRMNVNLEYLELQPLLQEQTNLFSLESRRQDIRLVIESEVEYVYADKVKLRQIFTNLLANAFKFTSQGEIRLKVAPAKAETLSPLQPKIIEISVADTGIGIDISKGDLLFEPFVQADGSIKRRYGGTGLGLTICKRLVELMGGQIWVDSPGKNQGTTVTFTLPGDPPPGIQG